MKKRASSSAPGKIHLIGEHSSVYGKPALLAAINKRLTVNIKISDKDAFFEEDIKARDAVCAIRSYISKKFHVVPVPISIQKESDISIGSGLGSSAALSAAIAGALFDLYDIPWNLEEIYGAGYEGEKIFHGNPSGGDLAVCVYGGLVWFRKETEGIKLFKKLSASKMPLCILINSGKPMESTRETVGKVAENYKKAPKKFDEIMNEQENLAKKLSKSLILTDYKAIREIIFSAEKNLELMGVVGKTGQEMLGTLWENKYAGKISGGGGIREGSGMIIVIDPKIKGIKILCQKNKWEYIEIALETVGLRKE